MEVTFGCRIIPFCNNCFFHFRSSYKIKIIFRLILKLIFFVKNLLFQKILKFKSSYNFRIRYTCPSYIEKINILNLIYHQNITLLANQRAAEISYFLYLFRSSVSNDETKGEIFIRQNIFQKFKFVFGNCKYTQNVTLSRNDLFILTKIKKFSKKVLEKIEFLFL